MVRTSCPQSAIRRASTSRSAGSSSITRTPNRGEIMFSSCLQGEESDRRGGRSDSGSTDELDWRLLSPHDDQEGRRFPELLRLIDRQHALHLTVLHGWRGIRRVLPRDDFVLPGRKNDRAIQRPIGFREGLWIERPRRLQRPSADDEKALRALGYQNALLDELFLGADDHEGRVL